MKNIFVLLEESRCKDPNQVYLVYREQRFTYDQIWRSARSLAQYLAKQGISSGDRVVLCLGNTPNYVVALFAVLWLNALVVPVTHNLTGERLAYILEKTVPSLVLTTGLLVRRFNQAAHKLIVFDDSLLQEMDQFDPLSGAEDWCGPESAAMVIFTSGTSGSPKGVVLSHRNLISNTQAILSYLHLDCTDSILVALPLGYAYGNSLLLTHTAVRAALYLEENTAYPSTVIDRIQQQKVTGFSTIGSYLHLMLRQSTFASADFSSLKYLTLAGEKASPADLEYLRTQFPHLKIYVMYGQTEAAARLSFLDPELVSSRPDSVGKAIPGVRLQVVDEAGYSVPPGTIGEIIAQGDNIMQGYYQDNPETSRVLKEGWLYTGDLAMIDANGFLYLKGRKDDLIKHLGHRISAVEIEEVINACPGVLESAVVGIEIDNRIEIRAYVILQDRDTSMEEIQRTLKKRLPSYMMPYLMVAVDQLPKTDSGKIMRRFLINTVGDSYK